MAYDDLPAPHAATHAPGAADPLTGYVDTTTAQTVAGNKTLSGSTVLNGQTAYNAAVRYASPVAGSITTSASTSRVIDRDASAGTVTVTMLSTTTSGFEWIITKTDSSANPVLVVPGASIAGWTGTTFGTAGTIALRRQYDSIIIQSTSTAGVYRLVGGTINPLRPAPEDLYANLTIPAGNTVSAIGNGTANQQKVFTSGPTIGANYFYPGMKVVLKGWGSFTATAAVNVQPEVYAGGVSGIKLIDAGALGLPSTQANCRYDFEIWLKCLTAGTSGTMECYGRLIFMNPTANAAGAVTFPVGASGSADATATGSSVVTYDTTQSRLIQLSAAYSSATSADTNTLRSIEAIGHPPSVYAA